MKSLQLTLLQAILIYRELKKVNFEEDWKIDTSYTLEKMPVTRELTINAIRDREEICAELGELFPELRELRE